MEYFLRFANLSVLFFLLPLVAICALLRLKWRRSSSYRYSLGSTLHEHKLVSRHNYKIIFFFMRLVVLTALAFLIGRPQLVDPRSNVLVEGIDMMLVLDVSGSMDFRDYGDDKASRLNIAKQEATRFIEKRTHDPMGLVIFGKDAVSRCPITADKNILKSIVKDLNMGFIDPDGTVLSQGILTAANRLKDSKAKSKIIILLTDGEPSAWDQPPDVAIEVARRMGIKIYTIGIGSDKDQYFRHPFYGMIKKPKVNKELLKQIANKTGGRFFLAENQKEMRTIYDIIDRLEVTEYETDLFSRYYDLFISFLWIVFIIMLMELFLSSLIWFSI